MISAFTSKDLSTLRRNIGKAIPKQRDVSQEPSSPKNSSSGSDKTIIDVKYEEDEEEVDISNDIHLIKKTTTITVEEEKAPIESLL
jgi:hypothetical protein